MNKTPLVMTIAVGLLLNSGGIYIQAAHAQQQSPATQVAPDDTGRNIRDRSGKTITPGDQSRRKEDIELTRRIRRAVVKDKALSTNAKNVKIITENGVVTLRGPVKSENEKAAIVAKAHQLAGNNEINNQLEVTGR